ncbi:MAG: polyphosphate kinase 2 family protein [Propionibacteriaceae bacterium]|nr:polyphosphate kinase 2 family protein [Propionibacteriaceae bacterium]
MSHSRRQTPPNALTVPERALPDTPLRQALRFRPGQSLSDLDPAATPGYPGRGKADADELTDLIRPALDQWQERLFADGKERGPAAGSVLVVLQGLDTAGKGGIVRHVFGLVDPQGLHLASFKQPTPEELSHHFLWRIRRQLPGPGLIGVFDRSHYEDVLVVRVDELIPAEQVDRRYEEINRFEADLQASGVRLVKCFLNISPQEQKERLLARLTDPAKWWKYSTNDIKVRAKWPAYQEAYQVALDRCGPAAAPWYVIPSDRKWYRNWAVAMLLLEELDDLAPTWPAPDYDVAAELARVRSS